MAVFYGVGAVVALAIAVWLVPMPRFAVSGVSAFIAFLLHGFAFLSFGMLFATEEEIAERILVFWVLACCIGCCGLVTWLLSIAVARNWPGAKHAA